MDNWCNRLNQFICDLWNFQANELASLKSGDYVKILAITRKFSKQYNYWIKTNDEETVNCFLMNLPLNNIEILYSVIKTTFDIT